MLTKEDLLKADQKLEKVTDEVIKILNAESKNPMTIEEFCHVMKEQERNSINN